MPALLTDPSLLRRLFDADRRDGLATAGLTEPTLSALLDQQFAARERALAASGTTDRTLRWAGEPVGRMLTRETGRCWRLVDVAVLPAYRGRGVGGRALLDWLTRADRAGVTTDLHVQPGVPAEAWYLRHGYVVTGDDVPRHLHRALPKEHP